MPRPIHFEIAADDTERAVKFYENVFGWKSSKWDGPFDYYLVSTGKSPEHGIDGGITKRRAKEQTTNTIGVDSVDQYAAKIREAGGQITMPKSAIPGIGWLVMALDSEGNAFGIIESDPSAQ
jgi:predicted enzyme related to lactoylglutathione lyase